MATWRATGDMWRAAAASWGPVSGLRADRIIVDDPTLGGGEPGPRREAIVQSADGSTCSVDAPVSWDLGDILGPGDAVAVDLLRKSEYDVLG